MLEWCSPNNASDLLLIRRWVALIQCNTNATTLFASQIFGVELRKVRYQVYHLLKFQLRWTSNNDKKWESLPKSSLQSSVPRTRSTCSWPLIWVLTCRHPSVWLSTSSRSSPKARRNVSIPFDYNQLRRHQSKRYPDDLHPLVQRSEHWRDLVEGKQWPASCFLPSSAAWSPSSHESIRCKRDIHDHARSIQVVGDPAHKIAQW